mmetsp:Transcript_1599/g.2921  ORF Transcript_1599/g.2921 Transcript_1599/m.2921 type:complete len:211 (+) Transcript_1599:19-651(+)
MIETATVRIGFLIISCNGWAMSPGSGRASASCGRGLIIRLPPWALHAPRGLEQLQHERMLLIDDLLQIACVLHDFLPVLLQVVPAGSLEVDEGGPAGVLDGRKDRNHSRTSERALRQENLAEPGKPGKEEAIGQRKHIDGELCQLKNVLVPHVGDLFRRQHRFELIGVKEVQQGFQRIAIDVLTQLNRCTGHSLPHAADKHGPEVRTSGL